MTTDALAPFTLPLRREGDAAIVDATGETVLVIDPDRHLENDEDAARLADRVFAMLTAAPVREEGGGWSAVRNVFVTYAGRFSQAARYEEASAIADMAAHDLAALATREEAPACEKCGGKGFTEYEGGEGEGYPSRPEIEVCSCRGEATAEAGEIDLYDDKVQAGIAWTMRQWGEALGLKTWTMGDGSESVEGDVGAEIHTILVDAGLRDPETNEMAALRAQPQACSGEGQ